MDKNVSAALVIAFLAIVLGLMVLGWYLRRKRQRGIPSLATPPSDLSDAVEFAGFYVSTTSVENPFDRIAVHGLGFRARRSFLLFAGTQAHSDRRNHEPLQTHFHIV